MASYWGSVARRVALATAGFTTGIVLLKPVILPDDSYENILKDWKTPAAYSLAITGAIFGNLIEYKKILK